MQLNQVVRRNHTHSNKAPHATRRAQRAGSGPKSPQNPKSAKSSREGLDLPKGPKGSKPSWLRPTEHPDTLRPSKSQWYRLWIQWRGKSWVRSGCANCVSVSCILAEYYDYVQP
eukprot:2076509-Prymnesium_polylepis.1